RHSRTAVTQKPPHAAEIPAVLARCHPSVALEYPAEKSRVLIANGGADRLHRVRAVLEHFLGNSDAHRLQIFSGQGSGRFFETADEVPRAHIEVTSEALDPDIAGVMLLDIGLGGANLLVVMRLREGQHRITGLAGPRHVDE